MLVPLRRMVEHYVKNHFDPVVVERFDQGFQLCSFPVIFVGGGVAAVGGEETDCIVTPVFQQPLSVHITGIHGLVKFKDRHQFHGVDSQFLQVGDFFHEAGKRAFVFHTGRLVFCVAPDMKLIDDKVAEFPVRLRHIAPVKGILHYAGVVGMFPVGAPDTLSGDRFGVGIEKNFGFVEKQAFFGVIGAVYTVGVLKIFDIQAVDDHGVNVPDLVGLREGDHCERLLLGVVEEQQFAGSAARGVDGEVYAVLKGGGPV